MTIEEIRTQVKTCSDQMNARYGHVVFNEWAVVSLADNKARVLFYIGPRNDDFLKNFVHDLGSLRTGLHGGQYGPGDFEFARHGTGTGYEAFMVLGQGYYLICNNTTETMDSIARDPRWLSAQVPFVELADRVRANPLGMPSETEFFTRRP